MKTFKQFSYKAFACIATLLSFQTVLMAQEKVEVNGNDVGSWFGQNWMWITGVVVLLLLIILFSGGSRRRRTTTVEHNGNGHKRVVTTTTEEND